MPEPERYLARSPMPVCARALFDWHARPGAFERLNPPFDPVEVVERSGGLQVGARTVLRMHAGPIAQRMVAVHTGVQDGVAFSDRQESGPFALWEQIHRMVPEGADRSILEDDVRYALPFGALGRVGGAHLARAKVEALFAYRHALTAADLARHAALPGPSLRVGITGIHGLIGTALRHFLTTGGHSVVALPRSGVQPSQLSGLDAVVNLAGAPVADGRWTAARKAEIRSSRVESTAALSRALAAASPRPPVLVSGSAIGFYGNRGGEHLDERSPRGTGFLAEVSEAWEEATQSAATAGVRVVHLRTGVVLTPSGGALAKMLLPFRLGAGGPVGDGSQIMSWISLEDAIGAIHFALRSESLRGPLNLTSPEPVANREFTRALGEVLHRPAVARLPAGVVRIAFGEMGVEALLGSAQVLPQKLLDAGFSFRWPGLRESLRFCLGKDRLPSAL